MQSDHLFLRLIILSLLIVGLTACEDEDEEGGGDEENGAVEATNMPTEVAGPGGPTAAAELTQAELVPGEWYRPVAGPNWQWQLSGELNLSYNVAMYDIDLFDTSTVTIQTLQARGIKIVCYFSAGSYEEWREDADQFDAVVRGEPLDGWPGER